MGCNKKARRTILAFFAYLLCVFVVLLNQSCSERKTHGWEIGEYGECSVQCNNGTQLRRVSCQELKSHAVVEDSLCSAKKPATNRPCVGENCGQWSFSAWRMCEGECGESTHIRDVLCQRGSLEIESSECLLSEEPISRGRCAEDSGCDFLGKCQEKVPTKTNSERCKVGSKQACQMEELKGVCEWRTPLEKVVDGGWSAWSKWSSCTKGCGGGTKRRTRSCVSPAPENGGRDCIGISSQESPCNTKPCVSQKVTKAAWSPWSRWSGCSKKCGGGTKERTRTCASSVTKNGRITCVGPLREEASCNPEPCEKGEKIDGGWSAWSNWGWCSKVCGGGTKRRSRRCDNPAPADGGKFCVGPMTESTECNVEPCSAPAPLVGTWARKGWGAGANCYCGRVDYKTPFVTKSSCELAVGCQKRSFGRVSWGQFEECACGEVTHETEFKTIQECEEKLCE